MKWATRDNLHLDRVAASWLVLRFLDPAGEIAFVSPDAFGAIPAGTITFGISGGTFPPHDERGTAFAKMLRHYRDSIPEAVRPGLDVLAVVVDAGVKFAIGHESEITAPAHLRAVGEGLAALSEGVVFSAASDEDNLARSTPIYDALLAYCAGHALMREDPALASMGLMARMHEIRSRLDSAGLIEG